MHKKHHVHQQRALVAALALVVVLAGATYAATYEHSPFSFQQKTQKNDLIQGAGLGLVTSACGSSCTGGYGSSCDMPSNVCGMHSSGIIQCDGSCNGVASPPNSACCSGSYGRICRTDPNACGMYTMGLVQCDGSCSQGSPPPDSACPTRAGGSLGGAAANNGTPGDASPDAGCYLDSPGAHVCYSAANSCGMTDVGFSCDGSCPVSVPSENLCYATPEVPGIAAAVNIGVTTPLKASPSLVRPGGTVAILWDVSNVQACLVSAPNGDHWVGASSGASGQISKPIDNEMIYTLYCIGWPGASPASITQTVKVNVPPVTHNL